MTTNTLSNTLSAARPAAQPVLASSHVSTGYVIRPEEIAHVAPASIPEGAYLARLAMGSLGNPGYVVLDYVDGRPADRIAISANGEPGIRAPRYVRSRTTGTEVVYRVATEPGFVGWTARD